jgi:protease-4
MCASGGYYVASAADEIYADKASLVGSIGVVMNSFGFVESMEKLGVERRLYTAGDNKGFLDPFSPEKPDEVNHVKSLLSQIHQQFIDVVKQGRGDKLKDDKQLFSGLIWTGDQAVKLGLVDSLGSSSYVAREIIKAEEIVDYTPKPSYLEQLIDRLGVAAAAELADTLQTNSISMQ